MCTLTLTGVVRRVVHNWATMSSGVLVNSSQPATVGHRLMVAVGGRKMWGRGAELALSL